MLISYMLLKYPNYREETPQLKELEEFYREAKKKFDTDPEFKLESQKKVLEL